MSNNANGNKRVILFSVAWYYGDNTISLHSEKIPQALSCLIVQQIIGDLARRGNVDTNKTQVF